MKVNESKARLNAFMNRHDDLYMVLIAGLVGVLAGYGNLLFRYLIGFFQDLFYGTKSEYVLDTLNNTPFYKILLIPAVGGLLVGLISIMFKFAKGHGVPDVMKAIALNRSISPQIAIVKSVSSAITLGSGGSAGREGPIVQIGAAIGSGVGKIFRFSSARMKTVIACGAAGGLAATFNAPIGGAMFAAEVLLGEFGLKTFSPIIISSVIATVVSRAYLGDHVTFEAPDYVLKSIFELPLYTILGIICALVGILFIRTFYRFEEKFESLQIPSWSKPAIGGLLMGVVALFSRDVMGVGYDTIDAILKHETGLILILLVLLKIIATSLTLGSGGSGGLFVPSLYIGAATGGFFGWFVNLLFPSMTGGPGAYGLVAMSAMLAATIRAPLTAILIIFEITQSYTVILPLMLAAIVANIFAGWLEKESIFTWILTKQGVRIRKGAEESVLEKLLVGDVMMKDVITFREDTHFREILEGVKLANHTYFPVLGSKGELTGMISLDNIREIMFEEGLEDIVVAGEICTRDNIIYVEPGDTLLKATERLGIKDLGALPVCIQKDDMLIFAGLLRRGDIIMQYNKAIASMRVQDA
ncbi:MAG: chloride channel protein [Denitrovibrio sp.]|nr:MAG: chloride channel protein [Denitrovibrio sp.]